MNSNSFLDLQRTPRRHGINPPGIPCRAPLVNRAAAHAEQGTQLGARAGGANRSIDRVCVHTRKSGTDRSGCQGEIFPRWTTESSSALRNAEDMDRKEAFAQRLGIALDHLKIAPNQAERKRYLAELVDITPRHAGNYLSGKKLPTPDGMIDLAIKLGVNPNWLWAGYGAMLPLTPEQTAHIEAVQTLPPATQARVFSVSEALATYDQGEQAQAS